MSRAAAGKSLAAALSVLTTAAASDTLAVEVAGETLFEVPVADGGEWCLWWNHSVTGGAVADCFVNEGGRMVLDRSYLHDFAAGLGEVPGRAAARAAEGGGYWIEGIDETIEGNALPVRVGRPSVDHRLEAGGAAYALSGRVAGQRVTLRLRP